MTAIEAIRERYDGQKRNPWNEFECGSNYARSMASYSLLNAFSGFRFDLSQGRIGFDPLQTEDGRFACFWSLDPGWGQFVLCPDQACVRLLYGELRLRVLDLPASAERDVQRVTLDGEVLPFAQSGGEIRFAEPVRVQRDQTLCVVAYTPVMASSIPGAGPGRPTRHQRLPGPGARRDPRQSRGGRRGS